MPLAVLHTSDAFVLRTYDYGEGHKIVVLFTRLDGLIRAVAHGARSSKNKYGAALELLSEVAITYREREGRDLAQLVTCDVKRTRFSAAADPATLAMLAYWAELVSELFPPHQANDPVYRLLSVGCEAIERRLSTGLDEARQAQPALAAYVETWLLRLAGFLPSWRQCARCGAFFDAEQPARLASDGTPACRSCVSAGRDIGPLTRRAYAAIQRFGPDEFLGQAVPTHVVADVAEVNSRLMQAVVERPLKSYAVWQRLRAETLE
ncbi:MAG: DNA repair protein RecO [Chloracidobacterium sp.]|uniref:DNA repair protein RecO n=1 Tax=Chloracidobacterium validum TaxID=2821543 RepID=A0ABX8B9A2_9BACT|nr:DNA repair protein RecO [Chloracidobacterium validum]QUW03518.1 DNA repair protein RecO [Chloracidobacterium validum]